MTSYSIIYNAIQQIASADPLTQIREDDIELMTETIMDRLLDAEKLVLET